MKKLITLLVLMMALQAPIALMAQDPDIENIPFTAILGEVFSLNLEDLTVPQTATFATASDYENGVWESAGIADGTSQISMEATVNWQLFINALDFTDGTQSIPINNLGVWVDEQGVHQIGTEVLCGAVDEASTQGLSNAAALLIDVNSAGGQTNAGTALDNLFTLHWRMGTVDNASMNPLTMLQQVADGDFGPGTYTTSVVLTMSVAP